ncbi:hypothetical protein AGMMS49975_11030 [Clostridia bacterium]|nr:hypothetical protein AGMMS49975_11030 [Clostridia bacterium]
MKVHRLAGNYSDHKEVEFIQNAFEDKTAETGYFVLAEDACPIWEYLKNINLTNGVLYQLKICKDFKADIGIVTDGRVVAAVHSIFELVKFIDIKHKVSLTVKDNNQRTLSNIYQQLIYLNFPINKFDIFLEAEYKDFNRLGRLRRGAKTLLETADKLTEDLKSVHSEVVSEDYLKTHVREPLKNIAERLTELSFEKDIKIAIAATKKTGKSVIVNSMLGVEIAPTSVDLPTPNACIYKAHDKNDFYTLEYNGKTAAYNSFGELHKVIVAEFDKAQKLKNNSIPDMTISYPKNLSKKGAADFGNYIIYDTPGPDFAASKGKHRECAKENIELSDVTVFALDYEKHLTDGEVAFLKEVKSLFASRKKFYSLIFVLNKIDVRYTSSGDKSVVRMLDLVRCKLIELGYDDCIILAASALNYWDACAVTDIDGCGRLGGDYAAIVNTLAKIADSGDDITDDERTTLSNLENAFKNMSKFDRIKSDSLDMIKDYSGITRLHSYIQYVAQTKAAAEKFKHISSEIDTECTKLRNFYNSNNLEEEIRNGKADIGKLKFAVRKFDERISYTFPPKGEIYPYEIDFFKDSDGTELSSEREPVSHKRLAASFLVALGNIKGGAPTLSSILKGCAETVFKDIYNEKTYAKKAVEDVKSNFKTALKKKHTAEKSELEKILTDSVKAALKRNDIENHQALETEVIPLYKSTASELLLGYECILNLRSDKAKKYADNLRKSFEEAGIQEFNVELPKFKFAFLYDPSEIKIPDLSSVFSKEFDKIFSNISKMGFWAKFFSGNWSFGDIYDIEKYSQTLINNFDMISGGLEISLRDALETSCKAAKDALIKNLDDTNKNTVAQTETFVAVCTNTALMVKESIENAKTAKEGDVEEKRKKYKFVKQIEKMTEEFMKSWKNISEGENGD